MIVEARDLHKTFGNVRALQGLDLEIAEGEILGVLGPNGAGKTTTINILTTLTRPDSGRVRVADIDVLAEPHRVRPLIGLTGQFAALDAQLTARENLVLFGRLFKLGARPAARRADQLLAQFGLEDAADRRTVTYSGGMRRRLDLAASMIGRPRVLFLDEPTTGLDPRSRNILWDVVRSLRDEGVTVLLTTQYLAEADELADRIIVIDKGAVIAAGTPTELKRLVGGAVCEITVGETQRTPVTDALSGRWEVAHTDTQVIIPADGAQTLFDVVRVLDEQRLVPEDIGLRHPTLDDVFLALTGSATSAGDTTDEPASTATGS